MKEAQGTLRELPREAQGRRRRRRRSSCWPRTRWSRRRVCARTRRRSRLSSASSPRSGPARAHAGAACPYRGGVPRRTRRSCRTRRKLAELEIERVEPAAALHAERSARAGHRIADRAGPPRHGARAGSASWQADGAAATSCYTELQRNMLLARRAAGRMRLAREPALRASARRSPQKRLRNLRDKRFAIANLEQQADQKKYAFDLYWKKHEEARIAEAHDRAEHGQRQRRRARDAAARAAERQCCCRCSSG